MGRTPSADVIDRIALAARDSLEAHGLLAVDLRGVASAAGVSKQTVLNRFDSMDGLIEYMAAQGFQELHRSLLGSRTMDDLLDRYRRWARTNPGLYRLMMGRAAPSVATRRSAELAIGGLPDHDAFLRTVGLLQLELSGLGVVGPSCEDR